MLTGEQGPDLERPRAMPTRIDSSPATHLAVCGCGWRGSTTRALEVAQRQARNHEDEQHPADRATRRHRAADLARRDLSGSSA